MSSNLKILVKFPSRGRLEQFLRVLRGMVLMSSDPSNIYYLISTDHDDLTMPPTIDRELDILLEHKYSLIRGQSKTKMQAINADMAFAPKDWDIVLLASDDMIPQVQGWDDIIRKGFKIPEAEGLEITSNPPIPENDLDQALWFFDGHQHRICTLVVMGRKRYERFGYLYHPSYISLWCDNEWTEVNQPKKFDQILFKHEHPAWGGQVPMDALYQRNEAFFERDRMNYEKRKQQNFPI